jgi:CBS domain-containing protein
MTAAVITVTADTPVREVAALLCTNGISGVPVIDEANRVIGIVSEGDLLHRVEIDTERQAKKRRHSWWLSSLASDTAPDYIKSHGRKVADVMSREVLSVSETTDLASVALLMETNGIKRVPVLKDGKLVGIISRANLVRALAAADPTASIANNDEQIIRNQVQDELIRKRLLDELSKTEWAKTIWAADVVVKDQKVHLWFSDDQPAEHRRAAQIAAENVPHVRSVEEHIFRSAPMPAF